MSKDISLKIGDVITPDFCSASKVIGIDRYTMKGFDGQTQGWDSYTLTSGSEKPYDRWWLVNVVGRGAHVFTGINVIPDKGLQFVKHLSGLVALNSAGNADLSSDKGALATYEDSDGILYAEEVFDGANRLIFTGRPFAI